SALGRRSRPSLAASRSGIDPHGRAVPGQSGLRGVGARRQSPRVTPRRHREPRRHHGPDAPCARPARRSHRAPFGGTPVRGLGSPGIMKISQEFVVARDPDTVWAYFQDIPSVARCLPGAELTGQNDDGSFEGKLSAKLGPMTAAFEGTATVTPDPGTRSARIEGKGVDRKGEIGRA